MRDPKRIGRILELFEEIWSRNPDLRFGQLVTNIQGLMLRPASSDPWFIEDTEWEEALQYMQEHGFKGRKRESNGSQPDDGVLSD